MTKEMISKYSITRNNGHLLDVFSLASYIELGNIPFEFMDKLLHFEVQKLDEMVYKAIQKKGIGRSQVENDDLKSILPFLFFENLHLKNLSLQIFLTYGLMKQKNERLKEIFSPIILIPVNLYFEKDNIYIQQISRPVENPILVSFLMSVKNINLSIPEKLDDIFAIDRFCSSLTKHPGLELKYENYLTFAFLKDNEIKIKHEKFISTKVMPDYLYDKLFSQSNQDTYYCTPLNRTQRYIVKNAMEGNNFVVSGRLGTGKTTALVNVAINTINQGKRVLYLSNMKNTLDNVFSFLEDRNLSQYATNFANLFTSIHKWEQIISPKAYSSKEEFANLMENYQFVNDYEKKMGERVLDQRFLDIVNELILLYHKPHQLLEIDDLQHLYKAEFLDIVHSLEIIQTSLGKMDSFKNNIWRDIPIYNNIKYPNQIVSLIYQIHKCFKILESEKTVLETDFGFKTLTNFAYLKNIIHSFKNLNIREVPDSWKEPTNGVFLQAKELFKNLKQEIFQLEEMESFLKHKYDHLETLNIKQELSNIEGHYFKEQEIDSINQILASRMELVVLVNKCKMQEDVFNKAAEKGRMMFQWDFHLEDDIILEIVTLSRFLHLHQINGKLLSHIKNGHFQDVMSQIQIIFATINQLTSEIALFKDYFTSLYLDDLDKTINIIYRNQNDDHTLTKKECKWLHQYETKQAELNALVITKLSRYYELKKELHLQQDHFTQITGYPASNQVLVDFQSFYAYLVSLENSNYKEKIAYFLDHFIDIMNEDYREMRNYLKALELLDHSHSDLWKYYEELYQYPFKDKKTTLVALIDDVNVIHSYLTKAYSSNDRLYEATKNTNDKFIKAEEYYTLNRQIDKINDLKAYLQNHKLYQQLYQDFYQAGQSNIAAITRLLETYEVYIECFDNPDALLNSLDFVVNEKILGHLNRCSEVSNEISEIFTVYFKIFRDDVSKYYYDSFANNIKRMNTLLKSKDELINYLIVTDNLQVLGKYRLDKFINYIVNCQDFSHLVYDFQFTYYSSIKDRYLEKHGYLQNFKALTACLNLVNTNENIIIKKNQEQVSRNLRKSTNLHFSTSGLKNLDYQGYIRRTKSFKRLFLANTQILNNFLNIDDFDLIIIDDAHLLSANEYFLAIEGKQVIVAGEMQLQSIVANNLMSRLSFATTIPLNYRFSQTPLRLLNHLNHLKGCITAKVNDNEGMEIIYNKLSTYLLILLKEQNDLKINLFVSSLEKQKRFYDELSDGLFKMGKTIEEVIDILKKQINIVDLRLSNLFDADYNVLVLEDYYKLDNEHVVVNLMDDLLLCKKRLIIYDNNEYLKRGNNFRFINELNKIINDNQIYYQEYATPLLQILARKLESSGLKVYSFNHDLQLLVQKDDQLFGILLLWSDNNFASDTLNQYRETYLLNGEQNFPVILIGTMELLSSFDEVVTRILSEINHE
ncbi:MAG: DEAD/DEAH box helicase [Bacilli bacterium]